MLSITGPNRGHVRRPPATIVTVHVGVERAEQIAEAVRAAGSFGGEEAADPVANDLADRICRGIADLPGVLGVSLCVFFTPKMSVPAGVSDPRAARAEEVQFSTGEGACWLAYGSGGVVTADLLDAATQRRWPAYTAAMRRQVTYPGVVAVPVRLAGGLQVVLNIYEPLAEAGRWWSSAGVVAQALEEVLVRRSVPEGRGGDWLDASTTLRRGVVWVAEALIVQEQGWLDHDSAQEALRTFSVVEGGTVDEVAAALVAGRLTVRDVLGVS